MVDCGEKLIDPDVEVVVDDGEHDTVCEIRDYLIHNNPKMSVEKAEDLGRFLLQLYPRANHDLLHSSAQIRPRGNKCYFLFM